MNSNSDLLFRNTQLSNFTIQYFLDNYEFNIVNSYFEEIGFDKNYIDDYESVEKIYEGLKYMLSVEIQNGDVDFVSKYFELEQTKLIAQKEQTIFYQGMENWLESGDIADLEQSLSVKKANVPGDLSIEDEKKEFLKSLTFEDRDVILKYENTKISIQRHYRNLTYRLKRFGKKLISDEGYLLLIE